ncbi:MAG: class I SAM-dependent methyltransferase [Halorientalis sp.]
MPTWDERFRAGEYPQDPDPDPLLERYVDAFPAGRALDVATGTGRNAVFLAAEGYRVDALDQSRAGLEITRENARERGVADRLEPIQTDVPSHGFPEERYAVVTISFYRALDRLSDIKAALEPGGYLFVQHHLRTTDDVDRGPSTDRYRFAANELLRACLDLTVVYYDERIERSDGRRGATARVLARNSTGQHQSYPELPSA